MAHMVLRRACWAKAVSLSKVMDLRSVGSLRANTASMTEMVSAAVFPTSLAASVTRDLRSWSTSTGRVRHRRFTPPAQLISSGGVKRRVAPAGQPIARQFARDRRLRTADRPSDGADRMAQDLQQTNLFSFVI